MNNPDSSSMILGGVAAVENKIKEPTNGGGFSPHIKQHKKAIQNQNAIGR
jgi:hypothetical protein|tara:strand:+ start:54 stop:203 length:150 start_codon:yes stop_codon:yes gene_type:complete